MTTRQELAAEGIDYYTELFKKQETSEGMCWFPRLVAGEMNLWLYRLPIEDEVGRVIASQLLELLKLPQSLSLRTNLHLLKATSSPITSCFLKNCFGDSVRKTQLAGSAES